MSDIFISYASEDRPKAKLLALGLMQSGWTVWWDRNILPGDTYDKVIETELASASCVVVLWTASSVASRWVRAEAGEALDRGVLLPALLEDISIPLVFRHVQAADLCDWQGETSHPGFRQLSEALIRLAPQALMPPVDEPATGAVSETDKAATHTSVDHASTDNSYSQIDEVRGDNTMLRWRVVPVLLLFALFASMLWYIYDKFSPLRPVEIPVVADSVAEISVAEIKATPKGEEMGGEVAVDSNGIAEAVAVEPSVVASVDAMKINAPVAKASDKNTITPAAPQRKSEAKHPKSNGETIKSPESKQVATVPVVKSTESAIFDSPIVKRNAALDQSSATRQAVTVSQLSVAIAAWGMPDDEDQAGKKEIRMFSQNLSRLMASKLESSDLAKLYDFSFKYHYPSVSEYQKLEFEGKNNKASEAICAAKHPDLVFFAFVESNYLGPDMGYAIWREPYYAMYDCSKKKKISGTYNVVEKNNDVFPYEKALADTFQQFLQFSVIDSK